MTMIVHTTEMHAHTTLTVVHVMDLRRSDFLLSFMLPSFRA